MKALSRISVTLSGITKSPLKVLYENAYSSIIFKFLPKVKVTLLTEPLNAYTPISITESGITKPLAKELLEKAEKPIFVTLLPSIKLSNPLKSNA